MEKVLEQILVELKGLKTGQGRLENNQERLENKFDSFRSTIVKDLTPYIENAEKHIDDSKNEIYSRFDRLERQVR